MNADKLQTFVSEHGYRLVNASRLQTFVSKHGYRLVNAGKLQTFVFYHDYRWLMMVSFKHLFPNMVIDW